MSAETNRLYPLKPRKLQANDLSADFKSVDFGNIDYEAASSFAGVLSLGVTEQLKDIFSPQIVIEKSVKPKPVDPGEFLADFKVRIHFKERDTEMQIVEDVIGLIRLLPGGRSETYQDKLRHEEKKGEKEAASYGVAELDDRKFVLFATHYDFFQGTVATVAGEKFVKAADLAIKMKAPFICAAASGGIRQQEGTPGLFQMPRIVNAIDEFKESTNLPFVAFLYGQTWGGMSASAISEGDVIIANSNISYGFAGPKVIESYQFKEVPEGAQSVEEHVKHRNLDVILEPEEVLPWLGKFLKVTSRRRNGKKHKEGFYTLPVMNDIPAPYEKFSGAIVNPNIIEGSIVRIDGKSIAEERLIYDSEHPIYNRYMSLIKDPRRPDMETILFNCFENVVPLYSRKIGKQIAEYPGIIAGISELGGIPVLVLGNQPSYQIKDDGTVVKIPSSPTPKDNAYFQKMLDFGARMGYPVVIVTDTPGAKPTLENEMAGQAASISGSIKKVIKYPHVVMAYVVGPLGSGGGISGAIGDYIVMSENAMAFVAEPTSAASILYKNPNPTRDQIENTIKTMRVTANDQLELGLVDKVLEEPEGGAQINPRIFLETMRQDMYENLIRLQKINKRNRLKQRRARIKNFKGIPIKEKK
ncbi:MAG: carboxyl transferase domain-containing protein [Candidatus Levybacteria bacterium]|nr:carboxyl transferase domain-containing protein [Candidatus Levybacteria bacterium]